LYPTSHPARFVHQYQQLGELIDEVLGLILA
jgi:hypothetical protein